jgi:two-component system, LytTR family, sensor kinase
MPDRTSPSPSSPDPLRSRRVLALFAGWWVLLAALFTLQLRMRSGFRGEAKPWVEALAGGVLDSFSWGLVALFAFWLAGRLQPRTSGWFALVTGHVIAAAAIIPARLWGFGAIADLLFGDRPAVLSTVQMIVIAFPTNLLAYVMLVIVGYVYHFVRRYRESELFAAQLEARLASAELEVMKMQLQPAFISRGLRTISVLMHRDLRAADRGLALLGDMLRLTLQRAQRQTVLLQDELELLELFVALQQEEFGSRLRVQWACEPDTLNAEVPSLLLQPALEQMIRGAADDAEEPLQLRVAARRLGAMLELEVASTGRARFAERRALEPAGLASVRTRLRQLYGPGQQLYLAECRENGTCVRFRVPFREVHGADTGTLVSGALAPLGAAV